VFNFDELAEVKTQAGSGLDSMLSVSSAIAKFYFHQSFLFFIQLAGVIPVVAASFTLLRMSRFNELTATLAAGVSLLRMAAPIIFCGIILNLVLLPIDQELLVPHMIPKLTRSHDELKLTDLTSYPVR